MKCVYLKVVGTSLGGGFLMMWDSRSWIETLVEAGKYSITYEFVSTHNLYTWYLTEVYAPHTLQYVGRNWLLLKPFMLVLGSHVETLTHNTMEEIKGYNIIFFLSDYSTWIHEMELHDPNYMVEFLHGSEALNHPSASRLDRFLFSMA